MKKSILIETEVGLRFCGEFDIGIRVKRENRVAPTSLLAMTGIRMPGEFRFLLVDSEGSLLLYSAFCASFSGYKMDLQPFRPLNDPRKPTLSNQSRYLNVNCWPRNGNSLLALKVNKQGLFLELYDLQIASRKF